MLKGMYHTLGLNCSFEMQIVYVKEKENTTKS